MKENYNNYFSDYLFAVHDLRDKSYWDMDEEERNKCKFEATCNMLDDLSVRLNKFELIQTVTSVYARMLDDLIDENKALSVRIKVLEDKNLKF